VGLTFSRRQDIDLHFTAPPSKSYTHRALIAASLARGNSRIIRPLDADDTRVTTGALQALGAEIVPDGEDLRVRGTDGNLRTPEGLTLDLRNSGTTMRLLASIALLSGGPVILTGSSRMQERPVGALASALNASGGRIEYLGKQGCPPIKVQGHFTGGRIAIPGDTSSQFISSILLAAPYADNEVDLSVTSTPRSRSYLDLTVDIMQAFGAGVRRNGYSRFTVDNQIKYSGREYMVEGDYSSASYFFAIAAACRGKVTVGNLNPHSVQGDRAFVDAVESMGCRVAYGKSEVTVEGTDVLEGIEIDMSSSPDTVQTLCVLAATARSPSRIKGIAHLRFKESDRIAAIADNLRALGGDVRAGDDFILIRPAPLHGGTIDPRDDHRTAMSFAVLGLAVGGISISDPECVRKSFPGFWDALRQGGLI
jgi:3-phosphoshikimate 1-carboxyvinyltransferase